MGKRGKKKKGKREKRNRVRGKGGKVEWCKALRSLTGQWSAGFVCRQGEVWQSETGQWITVEFEL